MKKFLLMMAVGASALTTSAQTNLGWYGNKFFDNWYIGINGGVTSKTTHNAVLKYLNPNVGLRLGKNFTPYFGVGVEGNIQFSNKLSAFPDGYSKSSTIRYEQIDFFADLNLTNTFLGYTGTPRDFEVYVLTGMGYSHNSGKGAIEDTWSNNHICNKWALDFAYNFGNDKQWQVYLEPSITYTIAGLVNEARTGNKEICYSINDSHLGLNVGLVYKFKTSNGSHNFLCATECDNSDLNDQINKLHEENEALKKALQQKPKTETKTVIVHDTINIAPATAAAPNLPSVFFQCNKSIITKVQQNNVRIAADVLKKNPEYKVAIKGYASVEGPADNNNSLGVRRANAVKDMLIKTYGIDPKRITATGCGATDQFSPVLDLNRVSMMILEK